MYTVQYHDIYVIRDTALIMTECTSQDFTTLPGRL